MFHHESKPGIPCRKYIKFRSHPLSLALTGRIRVFFGGVTQGGVRGLTLPWADELLPFQGAGKWLAAVSEVQRGGLAGVRYKSMGIRSRPRQLTR